MANCTPNGHYGFAKLSALQDIHRGLYSIRQLASLRCHSLAAGRLQWSQLRPGSIKELDYLDVDRNKKVYKGSATPPIYDFSKITNKNMAILWGGDDILADPVDIARFRNVIKPSNDHLMSSNSISIY